jgi:putative membrane protein
MAPEPAAERLHPLSPLFGAARVARSFVIPGLLVLFANRGEGEALWAGLGAVWALIAVAFVVGTSVLGYLVYRYTLAADELVIWDGLFTRTERHIPYARIQNIDLVQNPLHRAFDVALVRVETASGGRPEAVIRVLSLDAIEQMRSRVFAGRVAGVASKADAGPETADVRSAQGAGRRLVPRLPIGELAKLGLVSNKGMVVVGAVTGVLWQLDLVDEAEEYADAGRAWVSTLVGSPLVGTVAAGLTVLALAVLLLRLFSIGWYVVQLHGFTLTRVGDDLRAEYGLFTRVSRTVPTARIQALQTTESPLHRLFGRQSVSIQTVGGGMGTEVNLDGSGAAKHERQWLAPMVAPARVPDLVGEVHDGVDLRGVTWQPIAHRAWRRLFRIGLVVAAVVTVPLALVIGPWALGVVGVLALAAYLNARLTVKWTSFALTPWGLVFRTGWLNRVMKVVRFDKIQTVSSRETPFDRRHRMAAVRIDTAGGGMAGHTIDIPYLDTAVATALVGRLYAESSRRAFGW